MANEAVGEALQRIGACRGVDKRKAQIQKLAWFDQICCGESIVSIVAHALLIFLSEYLTKS